jgi:BirA family biotin operon repressor/biotin-[acetyl-CoA-carboxylase] ligase
MASAISMARAINGQLQWPNDIVLDGKKVAGILSEVIHTPDGDGITLVGIGVNVSQTHFPAEIAHRATSLLLAGHPSPSLDRLEADFISELIKIPTPESWDSLRAHWMERDQTPGKVYMLPDGNIGTAVEVTSNGSLNVAVLDKTIEVSVAEAIFG